jgi:hypothetical protein
VIPFVDYESRSYLSQEGMDVMALNVSLQHSSKDLYRRLGKLRVSKSGHDTVGIDSTNVRQFTMNLGTDSPGVIDVEGQVVNINNGKRLFASAKTKRTCGGYVEFYVL